MEITINYYAYEMNIESNLPEDFVNFVTTTKKQNKHFKVIIILLVVIKFCFQFLFF